MASKSVETCTTCVYGANNDNCSSANCKKCDMCTTVAGVIKCKCTTVRWGQECPYYVKEAGR